MELARLPVQRIAQRLVDGIDSTLLVIILALSMLGFAALFSASYDTPGRVLNQFVSLCIALTAMWVVAQLAPQSKAAGKLPVRYRVSMVVCKLCSNGIVRCELIAGQGNQTNVQKLAETHVSRDFVNAARSAGAL